MQLLPTTHLARHSRGQSAKDGCIRGHTHENVPMRLSRGCFAVVEHDRVVSMRLDESKATATDARVEQVDRTDAAGYANSRVRRRAALVKEVDTHIGAHV